ncbi:hypothetical protein DICPUDRAFT_28977 [Dictyostelium purpureum]|uniref:Uncharacterized protein n=1 Tax=Dictyostelium purpureum TaxID=5786 RepID=F0ZCT7_DICPU|nr:uncharacterized protein DICPUDRAFT_28977 [Dictyostelium purpureum]EGC38258.1 hypothetical protein DICPUDRAFT_28977 [Dictyostelium purpureum]|eukprot:XP_003285215.1 hypothetical protein DICPUDRAFT_28977 [Dictyostelium purpureum]
MEQDNNNDNIEGTEETYINPNEAHSEVVIDQKPVVEDDEDMMDEGGDEGMEDAEPEEDEDFVDESVQGFFEHTDSVYCINNNKVYPGVVATGGGDDTAYIWNYTNGEKIHQLKGHTDSVSKIQFNFDGKLLATGGMDGIVKIWDAQSGTLQVNLEGPTESIECMEWHPKGNILLAGSSDCLAFMWSTLKGDIVGTFAGHNGPVTCAMFTPDGKKVITTSEDRSMKVWNPKDSTNQFTFTGHGFHENIITCMDIRKDSVIAVTGGDDHFACVSNLNTGKVIGKLNGHTDAIVSISMSNVNQNWCHTGSLEGTINVWDVNTLQQRSTFKHKNTVTKLLAHPTQPVVFSSSVDKTIGVWDERNGQLIKQFRGHQDSILDFDITNDGRVISASDDKVSLVFSLNPPSN